MQSMEGSTTPIKLEEILSWAADLVQCLRTENDLTDLKKFAEGSRKLRDSCDAESEEVRRLIEDYQMKINLCKQKIDDAKGKSIADTELQHLQNELEEEFQTEKLLRQELRAVSNEIDSLERQRACVEEQNKAVKKVKRDEIMKERMLSMCASVTKIIPCLDDETKISGYVVDRDKKKMEVFEFESANSPPIEICNKLWKMSLR